ncbi:hypothetical protein PMZ80_000057 [Knufia obscura]|uniref:Uncharacterized protein n=2 Tax=Knufia TaxID=430999 RepID=A0AAN8EEG9_9EURO|nr:hypothetical protein PMZ80_000057 [Knufia obscura]KAK5948762.1 hypothetical protein OHC33_010185 [Knufia fluminis]
MTDIINDVKNAGATFTSWDSCMSKTYCKWPVIAAIILGAVIVLSVLWCLFSCLCCGISLCTACVKCLTCGNCCGACRGSRRRKDPEYHPMPPTPTPYQGYQPQPSPMMYNNHGPQFATFDTGTKSAKIHEDSLPHMPSWDNAATRRVEDHSQQRGSDLEMERMLPQSPVREQPYGRQSQPYASDLGAQSLDQRGAANDYYDTPLSPAPTYYSSAPAAAAATAPLNRDHFSPQQNFHQNTSYDRGLSPSVAPYPSSRESTQFTPSVSPPSAPSYTPYQSPPLQQNDGVRPPSLLQVGRKPVAGSYREV